METAEAELKKCGFQVATDPNATLDGNGTTLYADKRVTHLIIDERTQVLVKVDAANKVESVTVTETLTGP